MNTFFAALSKNVYYIIKNYSLGSVSMLCIKYGSSFTSFEHRKII